MKYLFLLCITTGCLLIACNNNQKPTGELTGENKDSAAGPEITKDNQEIQEELQHLSPYNTEQMKSILPGEIAGGKLSEPSSGKRSGTCYASGAYPINDSTMIELSLFDCGGDAGSGYYHYQFLNRLNAKPEEYEEKNVSDFNGSRAIELYNFNSYRSSFTYLDTRLLVSLESETIDMEELKKIAGNLKLKQ